MANTIAGIPAETYAGSLARFPAGIPGDIMDSEQQAWAAWGGEVGQDLAPVGFDEPDELGSQVHAHQTCLDLDGELAGHSKTVEMYDYVRDGVVFEGAAEIPAEVSAQEPARLTSKLVQWAGRGVLVPAGEARLIEEGDDVVTLSVNFTVQKPSVTFDQAKAVAKVSGNALRETLKETLQPDKEAIAAVAFVCGHIIIQHAEYLGDTSLVDLIGSIRQSHPKLPKEPQFRSAIGRLSKDPEGFKQAFAGLDQKHRQALIEQLPLVPAFHEFCEKHTINPNQVLEV